MVGAQGSPEEQVTAAAEASAARAGPSASGGEPTRGRPRQQARRDGGHDPQYLQGGAGEAQVRRGGAPQVRAAALYCEDCNCEGAPGCLGCPMCGKPWDCPEPRRPRGARGGNGSAEQQQHQVPDQPDWRPSDPRHSRCSRCRLQCEERDAVCSMCGAPFLGPGSSSASESSGDHHPDAGPSQPQPSVQAGGSSGSQGPPPPPIRQAPHEAHVGAMGLPPPPVYPTAPYFKAPPWNFHRAVQIRAPILPNGSRGPPVLFAGHPIPPYEGRLELEARRAATAAPARDDPGQQGEILGADQGDAHHGDQQPDDDEEDHSLLQCPVAAKSGGQYAGLHGPAYDGVGRHHNATSGSATIHQVAAESGGREAAGGMEGDDTVQVPGATYVRR